MMYAVRMGGRKVSFTMKSCVCASTWIPGRDLFTCREYIRISLCYCVLFLINACALLLLKWCGRVFSVLYQDSACLHTSTKYIYIYYTHQLWWNILDWRAVLSKYNTLLVKGQVFNGNVGHFRILRRCYKQCIMLAIYWLFPQANANYSNKNNAL
jgi:hypothetical protein